MQRNIASLAQCDNLLSILHHCAGGGGGDGLAVGLGCEEEGTIVLQKVEDLKIFQTLSYECAVIKISLL